MAGGPGPARTAPARTAPRVAVTRERIIAAAFELFAERGFAGTSVRDISAALGVTKAALYYHFTSKDEILDAIVNPVLDRFETFAQAAAARPDSTPRQLLTDLADVLAATATALSPFVNDPSVLHHSARTRGLKATFETIVTRLAESVPGPFGVLRVRCAIGAVQAAVISTVLPLDNGTGGDEAADERPAGGRSTSAAPTMSPQVRDEIVGAALRALGDVPTD